MPVIIIIFFFGKISLAIFEIAGFDNLVKGTLVLKPGLLLCNSPGPQCFSPHFP